MKKENKKNIIEHTPKYYLFKNELGENLKEIYGDMCLKCKVEGWTDSYQYFLTEGAFYDYCKNTIGITPEPDNNDSIENLQEVYVIIKNTKKIGEENAIIEIEYICDSLKLVEAILNKEYRSCYKKVIDTMGRSSVRWLRGLGFGFKDSEENEKILIYYKKMPFKCLKRDAHIEKS